MPDGSGDFFSVALQNLSIEIWCDYLFFGRLDFVGHHDGICGPRGQAQAGGVLVQDALLAASCRESGVTLITRDRDFDRFRRLLPGWKTTAPWPTHQG